MADQAATANLSLAFGLPPERAIEYFQSKGLRISRSAQDMLAGAHARAFTVAGVLKADVLQDIRDAVSDALANGQTYDQFVKALRPLLQKKGWWGVVHDPDTGEVQPGRAMTPMRLRTVYQTNLQSAYMAGRYKAQLENADARPYWEYVAVLDNRTRPRHRALSGRIFRYDDPVWGSIYPPNGYKCRCRVQALSAAGFKDQGGGLSDDTDHMETRTVDLGPRGKGGKVQVTGYKDPATGDFFAPDPGFDNNPGQSAYGLDTAMARNVQALKSRDLRSQVWQALNNSPLRQAQFTQWADAVLDAARPGNSTQVIGFIDESIADFWAQHVPDVAPVRIAAINEKRLVHADSARHVEDGLALNRDQVAMLPGIIAAPDAVYFDRKYGNLDYVRNLSDGSVIYIALTPYTNVKQAGRIDLLVNAYRLQPGAAGAGRLQDTARYVLHAQTQTKGE